MNGIDFATNGIDFATNGIDIATNGIDIATNENPQTRAVKRQTGIFSISVSLFMSSKT